MIQTTLQFEEWRDVIGYVGRYQVSSRGNVFSMKSDKVLSPAPNSKGYLCVSLYDGSSPKRPRSYCVHDLVAVAFLGPKPQGYQVDHGEYGKRCNSVDNLEYVTGKENMRRAALAGLINTQHGAAHMNAKLSWDDVAEIRRRGSTESRAALAKEFGVAPDTIRDVIRMRTYKPEFQKAV